MLERRFPDAPREGVVAALHAHDGDAAEVTRRLLSEGYRHVPCEPVRQAQGEAASTVEARVEAAAAPAPRARPPPPLPHHLRALADRRASEILPRELERLSPASSNALEVRYKQTPFYNNNRPYVPLWRCLAAALQEPLLLLLRQLPKQTPSSESEALCDLYWRNAIELPLMPLVALEALAQQYPGLLLKPHLAETRSTAHR